MVSESFGELEPRVGEEERPVTKMEIGSGAAGKSRKNQGSEARSDRCAPRWTEQQQLDGVDELDVEEVFDLGSVHRLQVITSPGPTGGDGSGREHQQRWLGTPTSASASSPTRS